MNRSPVAVATGAFLILAGTVWVLQGFDVRFAPQSFMTANRWWVLWGGLAIFVGTLLLIRVYRKQ